MRNGTTGKEVLDKLYLCKLLMDKLYEDIQKEAIENGVAADTKVYSFPNGTRYKNDSIRLRRELNELNKLITY